MSKNKDGIERGWIDGEKQYVTKTKDEIRQIALDVMTGSAYGSWQMSDKDHLSMVFLPLIGIDDFVIKGWQRDEVIHFYGHIKDALNRSINGMPIFHSFCVIDQPDLDRVFKMIRLIEQLEEID